MGGGMRQAGYFAAAGIYALENNIARLEEDHKKARLLEKELKALPYVKAILPVETNIVIFTLNDSVPMDQLLEWLPSKNVRASSMGPQIVRVVFHLDITNSDFEELVAALRAFQF